MLVTSRSGHFRVADSVPAAFGPANPGTFRASVPFYRPGEHHPAISGRDPDVTQPAIKTPAKPTPKTTASKRRNAASHTLPGHRSARAAVPAPNLAVETDPTTDTPTADTLTADALTADASAVETEAILDDNPVEATADLDEVVQAADLVRSYLNEIGKVSLLTAVEEVELSKRIEAGLYAEHLLGTSKRLALPRRRELQSLVADGETRQGPAAACQPAAGGVAGQALHRTRHAVPGPDPGGQPGPDPGGGEVRLHQGLQVLHLRHLVDPAGDQPGDGRPVAHHPAARPPGRADQQDAADASRTGPEPGPGRHRRRAGQRAGHHRRAAARAGRPCP